MRESLEITGVGELKDRLGAMVFHIQINPSGEETLIASLIHLSVIYHLPVYHLSIYLSPIYLLSIIYLPIISIYHLSIYIYIYLSINH